MKTRIKTGIIIGLVFLAVVISGKIFEGYFIYDIVITALCGIGLWEMLYNTGFVKSKFITIISIIFSLYNVLGFGKINFPIWEYRDVLSAVFVITLFIYSMFFTKNSSAVEPMLAFSMTFILSYCFGSLLYLVLASKESGVFYLLLCLDLAWVSDIGAYFVGSKFGKHKLCPEISPKKTVEGAIGGVVFCLIVTLIFGLVFNMLSSTYSVNIPVMLLITAPLSVVGMLGDLAFSSIKRYCGIKDYGKILPGHGGILDRFDSILAIAPVLYVLVAIVPVISEI